MKLIKNLYQLVHQQGRCCLQCGSFSVGASQFCVSCEKDLWTMHSYLKVAQLGARPTKVTALFDWYPDQDRKVSKLIMAMKGGYLSEASLFYASSFVSRLYGDFLPSDCVLVPCPGQLGRRHAEVLAEKFSQILQVPLHQALQKTSLKTEQKRQSKAERYFTEFTCLEPLPGKHVIFIDDIVTTGATALSAQRALGPMKGYEVWCLAHRCQLATNIAF